jgi:hypothetical protein
LGAKLFIIGEPGFLPASRSNRIEPADWLKPVTVDMRQRPYEIRT